MKLTYFAIFVFCLISYEVSAQLTSSQYEKIYPNFAPSSNLFTSLDKAILKPDSVKRLSLNFQGFSEIPEDVRKLNNLVFLDVANNEIDTLPLWFCQMKSLKALWIGNNQNIDLMNLCSTVACTNIEYLWIGKNRMNLPKGCIRKMYGLKRLFVMRNNSWNFKILLKECIYLKELIVLDLSYNNIDINTLLPYFKSLKQIEVLIIQGNKFNVDTIDELKESLPDTDIIYE